MGRFLRKTKINELPQLVNVFLGQMSLIGYRPLVRQGYELYSDTMKERLYNYRPGLSGIGSIAVHNEEYVLQKIKDKNHFYKTVIIPYKEALETWYINNANIFLYFVLLFLTIFVLVKPNTTIWKVVFKSLPDEPIEFASYREEK
jgi:lipopolysaccharide/colanic/teichoic acid biosynthesis glycosyltransferase